jgi:DNA-binding NarL/FixJ family response regulator
VTARTRFGRSTSIGRSSHDRPAHAPETSGSLKVLSQREREVLRLLADGLRNEEIGRRPHIAGETARAHIRNAMRKLDAATRTEAVATALRHSMIE